jgi:hypothetical protein
MSDFEEIQKLIRLKRHEGPPEGFVDDFITSFHQRQRSEMLQRSARSLLWERVTTYFSDMFNPKWAWASASVAAVALIGLSLRPHTGTGLQVAQTGTQTKNQDGSFEVSGFAATDPNAFMANVENYLTATEFEPDGGPASQRLVKPRIVQPRQGEMIPAGLGNRPGFMIQR